MPKDARKVIGFQLERLQLGKEPLNWKPLKGLGKGITGVREIRVEIDTNIYRSAYIKPGLVMQEWFSMIGIRNRIKQLNQTKS